MASKKVIVVFGATGNQGGSVARAILEDKNICVRVATRDVTKPAAVALQDLGAEVVKCDLNSKEDVNGILKGAYGAFLVTNFWEGYSKEKEVKQVGNGTIDAVTSSLSSVYSVRTLMGRGSGGVFCPIGVPMTSVRLSAYFENFLTLWKPVKASDGDYYNLILPMKDIPLDGISVADIGPAVASIFRSPEEFLGKAVGLSAEALTVQQYADILSKTLGKVVKDSKITPEAYEKLGFPGAKEMADMMRFYHMRPDRDVQLTHKLNPKVKSFSQFVSENKGVFTDL
uniref:NmrA-like family domain-containing protein 1 n=1 Tax=Monodelphis domestica TaxID=13616 RepID=A0A5F8GH01_MONDO